MPTSVNLTGNIADLVGTDFDARRTKVWVTANTEVIVDGTGNAVRLGDSYATVADDGTFTFTGLWATNSATNPTAFQYRLHIDYPKRSTSKGREVWDSGWFDLTATSDIADVTQTQYVPPTWMTTATATLQDYVDDAEAARTGAEAARDAAVDISNIDTSDAVVEALVKNTGGAGPLTSGALAAKYVAPAGKTTTGPAAPLPFINVRDFGAVGDGIADDTAAIQAAATAAAGGVLHVAAGHYLLTAPVNLPGSIKIEGDSAKAGDASRFTTSHSGYAFVAPAASNFRIEVRNLHVTCTNGFDLRSTTRSEIGLVSFDSVAFSGGDGTGVAINCLNHDFSKITNCGFFWNGLCAIRLSGWYGAGGIKGITAMEVSNNYFGAPLKIGVSADIFESLYCQQNDFGAVNYPVDIGGYRFDALTDGVSLHYFKRGEAKPVEGYFGTGTNFYFNENHMEGAICAVTAWGKSDELKSLHVSRNNYFPFDNASTFARIAEAVMSVFADNQIDYGTFPTSKCFDYSGTINLTLRNNHHFTRVSAGAANANTYVAGASNFFTNITRGATGTAYDSSAIPSDDTGWVSLTLANSWANYGGAYPNAQVRKIGNRVQYRGLIRDGTTTAGTTLFTTPYPPPFPKYFTAGSNNAASGLIYVDSSTGNAAFYAGNNVWLDLSGMTYLTD